MLKSNIIIHEKKHGEIMVLYPEEVLEPGEETFLYEEQELLDEVSKQFSLFIENRKVREEREQLQMQLRHADRLATIGELAAGVAHEINEPLGNILGFGQLTQKRSDLPDETKNDIEQIIGASLHAREIVKKLLIFARQMPSEKKKVNLNHIIEDGLYFFESRCVKEGVRVIRELDEDLPDIPADPAQFHQVLVNLVVNAIQAMPNGGTLRISTKHSASDVFLTVEDSGKGIEEEVIEKIFDPFFTTKDVGKGTGLGLAVTHGIVSAHNGKISVKSGRDGGACFTITLPIDSELLKMRKQNG